MVVSSIISGTGKAPKNIGVLAKVLLSAPDITVQAYEWDLLSAPENSNAVLSDPTISTPTIILDKIGVYLIRLIANRYEQTMKTSTIALNVPGGISPMPPDPLFATGGRIRNFSFELPGIFPGWAHNWITRDDANVLSNGAGITRGRIIPANFNVNSGYYAMCLGDDDALPQYFRVGDIFSISQEVDFTDMHVLKFQFKFRK